MAKTFDALAKKTMRKAARDRADERAHEIMAELALSELRQAVGLNQKELATALGMKQPTLSRLEQQDDMRISTLHRLIQGLGGELEIVAHFPKGNVRIRQFGEQVQEPAKATQGKVKAKRPKTRKAKVA